MTIGSARDDTGAASPTLTWGEGDGLEGVIETVQRAQPSWAVQ